MIRQRIKVAHVIKDLDLGGIQTLLLDVLNYYRENNFPYILVCIGSGELEGKFREHNSRVFFVKKRLPFFDPFAVWQLRKLLIEEQVGVVHAHHTSEGLAALIASAWTGIKYVQSFHVAPNISNWQDNSALKFLARYSDAGISPSEAQSTSLQKAGYNLTKINTVLNGVHPDRLKPQNKRSIRNELGVHPGSKLMVSIGNFYNDTRDQLTICKALPAVFKEFPDVRMVFYGGVLNRYTKNPKRYLSCKAFCEAEGIADKVFFPGKDSDIGSILGQSDIFVYSSLGDTFGMAVVEAMLSGVPVVANNLPVLCEVTGGDDNVFLFDTRNPDSASKAIIEALSGTGTESRASNAKRYARRNYLIGEHVERLSDVYEIALNSRG